MNVGRQYEFNTPCIMQIIARLYGHSFTKQFFTDYIFDTFSVYDIVIRQKVIRWLQEWIINVKLYPGGCFVISKWDENNLISFKKDYGFNSLYRLIRL